MEHPTRTSTIPTKSFTAYARKSTTGENYPGTPVTDYVPTYAERFEWLRDGVGPGAFNPCEHYLRQCSLDRPYQDGSDTWVSPSNHSLGYWNVDYVTTPFCWGGTRYGSASSYGVSGELGAWDYPITGLPLLYKDDILGKRLILPDNAVAVALIDRSLQAMLPGIRPLLSLPNTLYELKDIKTAARSLKRINAALDASNRLKEAYRLSKQALKLLSGKTRKDFASAALKSILKAGSDSYLQAQFNVAPLLKDIAGINFAIRNAERQVKDLVRRANRRQVSHFRAKLTDQYVPRIDTKTIVIPNTFVGTNVIGRREVTYPVAEFCATLEYSYRMPFPGTLEDYLPGALGDLFGANLNPQILWNAAPWSFVFDWLIGVNRWLGQFQTRNIEPVTSISRYCFSIHVKREIKLSIGESSNAVPFSRFWEEAYFRKPHVPDLLRSIESSGLNPKEFSLAAALALSR
jgi:hypothetical protein